MLSSAKFQFFRETLVEKYSSTPPIHFMFEWGTGTSCCYVPSSLLTPTGHVMHQQFNIQQLYVLPNTLYLCVLYLSENKQRLVPLIS
jgi:hypothetical protein